ncbi:NAD-dependent epimerase/dehydratase family protein [Haliangium ochraceum]|uniref:NAD-dependent epimerase/dehydratase n=1 Tax=Haliangium ochraceum (strain DSM 14365 / JCM 11303 / SMP-2) TaxID=502025 RepID=D0LIQ8_HALO1|nr:NAD-dependent epimerase/dehydratase family protein [Haliangium ochraceum]ACY12937.1 NAD-dependent epimerase/dehydratase [Haliangium ochraceum DSM 14365]
MPTGRRILITGGAGFIGSHLCERLLTDNDVVVLDTFRRDALSSTGLSEHPRIRVVRGDVLDAATVADAMAGCDAVIHMASIAGVDTVMRNPVLTMRIAMLGTMNLLEAARESGEVKRFIDFSTSEVFGRYAYQVTEFDSTVLGAVGEARWTYAVAKLATEHLAMNYQKEFGLPACSIRPFNIYGPRQVGEGAIHHFIRRALTGETLQVHNDGAQIRAWCYIDDIVDAILLALEREQSVGHAFNIGNPRSTVTIYQLARDIVRLSGSSSAIEFHPWPHPDVEIRVPAVAKARELLGFEAQVDLEQGLKRTIAWYRDHGNRVG